VYLLYHLSSSVMSFMNEHVVTGDDASISGEELVKLDRTFENLPLIMENPIAYAQNLPIEEGPRLIKTHMALPLLPSGTNDY
jgi:hypothetical protein